MGVDKATLVLDDETLLGRAARNLGDAGASPVVVATGRAGRLGPLPWTEVDDGAHAGAGPLAGLLAALRLAPRPIVAVLAVDLPAASPAAFRWLVRQWHPDDSALVPVDADGRAQPLHALWRADAAVADAIDGQLASGERRVQRVLAGLGARRLDVPAAVAEPGWSRNWNGPDDTGPS